MLYAEDFDEDGDPPAAPAAEPEVIEPGFTGAELDAARAEAREAGRRDVEHGLVAARVRAVELIAAGLADARAAAAEVAEDTALAVARAVLAATAACLPALCARHGAAEVAALARALLPALRTEPKVAVRVNPLLLAGLQDELGAMDAELAERVQLLPVDAMPPGDLRVSWAGGSAVRDAAEARAAVRDGLARLGLWEGETADA